MLISVAISSRLSIIQILHEDVVTQTELYNIHYQGYHWFIDQGKWLVNHKKEKRKNSLKKRSNSERNIVLYVSDQVKKEKYKSQKAAIF